MVWASLTYLVGAEAKVAIHFDPAFFEEVFSKIPWYLTLFYEQVDVLPPSAIQMATDRGDGTVLYGREEWF